MLAGGEREHLAWGWRLAAAALLMVAAFTALFQLDRYPLEEHEIFVAQTAREMAARGDWVVPYFNLDSRKSS